MHNIILTCVFLMPYVDSASVGKAKKVGACFAGAAS